MTEHPRFSACLPQGLRLPRWAALLLCASLLWSSAATAQTLRASNQFNSLLAANSAGPQTADFIVALVNSEPVTNNDVRQRLLRLEQQLAQQGTALPPRAELAREVLEQLVLEMVQVQQANELGLRVDDATLLQAEQAIAEQNQLPLEAFRLRVVEQGIDLNSLRRNLKNQLLLQRVRDREVQARVNVTESDIDTYIRNKQSNFDPSQQALNLAHVLVQVPEGASDALVRERQARAQAVADRARNGHDFAALARDFSDAPERSNGGAFGLRPADRLPDLFVQAVRTVPAGGIAGPIRSAAGFHVLKVLEKSQLGLPDMVVIQTRARHILLRTGPQLSQEAAVARLSQFRTQISSGQASFPALAREHSQDGSAREGGDPRPVCARI